jgi:hypothetical protein
MPAFIALAADDRLGLVSGEYQDFQKMASGQTAGRVAYVSKWFTWVRDEKARQIDRYVDQRVRRLVKRKRLTVTGLPTTTDKWIHGRKGVYRSVSRIIFCI